MSASSAPPPPVKDLERLRLSASPSPIADRFTQQGQRSRERPVSTGPSAEAPPHTHVPVHTRHLGPKQHVLAHGHRMSGSHRTGRDSTGIAHDASLPGSHTQPHMRLEAAEGHGRPSHRSRPIEDARQFQDVPTRTNGRQSGHIHHPEPVPGARSESTDPPAPSHSFAADPGRNSTPSTEEKERSIDEAAAHDNKSPFMSRLKRHFVSRSPLTSTWEKKSFVEECRSAPPLLEHERSGSGVRSAGDADGDNLEMMEQGVPRGRRSEASYSRPTSLYASPAALRAFNPLPQVQMSGQGPARSPLSGVHQNVPPVPAASSSSRGVPDTTHGAGHGAHSHPHSHHPDGRGRHGGHEDHSKCRECDAIWNCAV